jgi:NAD(P)-dependent dehydrogenase (short-subunit alcohol dehydrogenase family)
VIDVNLSGPFYCAQAAAKEMIKQKSGRIIFITSGQALRGVPLMAHYSAAKGGLVALARAMASELGVFGITVNTIAAGLTTTDTVNGTLPPELLQGISQQVPLKRLATPDEYNGAAILLASDDGAYITAETIAVDGGTANADAARLEI